MKRHLLPLLCCSLSFAACASTRGALDAPDALPTILDTRRGEQVGPLEVARALADHDVVFLGELHDSAEGHSLQLTLTTLLLGFRPDAVLSLEMFERDAQDALDLYFAGQISEETFLSGSRPWKDYERYYRPALELFRERGLPVLAANAPRSLAAAVGREGLSAVEGDEFAPRSIEAGAGEYRRRFDQAMAGHPGANAETIERMFQAQCVKDEAMAESIADHLATRAPDSPLVVHWCGRFHSDYHLGTVERLARRRPDLAIAVVGMLRPSESGGLISADELAAGDWLVLVPPAPQRADAD